MRRAILSDKAYVDSVGMLSDLLDRERREIYDVPSDEQVEHGVDIRRLEQHRNIVATNLQCEVDDPYHPLPVDIRVEQCVLQEGLVVCDSRRRRNERGDIIGKKISETSVR